LLLEVTVFKVYGFPGASPDISISQTLQTYSDAMAKENVTLRGTTKRKWRKPCQRPTKGATDAEIAFLREGEKGLSEKCSV
jgi:hypothetical protein